MDDQVSTEDVKNLPVSELTRKFYNDILNAMEARAKHAKAQLDEVQAALAELAGIVNPEWMFEQRVTKKRGVNEITIGELLPVVKKSAKEAHMAMLKARPTQLDVGSLRTEVETLKIELAKAIQDRDLHREASLRNQAQVDEMSKKLSELADGALVSREDRAIVQAMVSGDFDDGMQALKASKRRDRLEFLIGCIGERGEILSPDLARRIAEQYNIADQRSSSISDLLAEAESIWLISQSESDVRRPGQRPKMVKLTQLGEFAYEQLFSQSPQKTDYAKEHKTEAHAALIVRAEEILRRVGYEILRGIEIKQGSEHTFQPDITARKDGHLIYVEVERDATKGNQDFGIKAQNFRNFANGEMYFFCENYNAYREVLRFLNTEFKGYGGDVYRISDMTKIPKTPTSPDELWTKAIKV